MDAKEFLQQIRMIDEIIKDKKEEIRRLDEIASSMGSFSTGDRVQSTRNPHKMSNAIDEIIDLDNEIKKLSAKRKAIMDIIQKLPLDEYKLIYGLYVKGLLLKSVAVECNKSYDWARKAHPKALSRIQTMIDDQ